MGAANTTTGQRTSLYTFVVAIAKIHQLGYALLPPSSISPDLVPSDYFLFLNLKKWLEDQRFESNAEVDTETILRALRKPITLRDYEIGKGFD